jgi:1-acyl-sn-glycerol-3-phosphate acyltransferase
MNARERILVAINSSDILTALGWPENRRLPRGIALAVRWPALVFARQVLAFDDEVAASGIREAAQRLLPSYVRDLAIHGAERIPTRGPVLLLSNHPGMTDTLSLFAAIPRTDLRILAADRPFLRALHATARSLIFIPDQEDKRLPAVRQAIQHLRSGGALLTFPAGEIEPDPAVLPGAAETIQRWSPSSTLFLRFVPDSVVMPVVVSGVLSRRAQRNPLTLLRGNRADRERLGAMLQMVAQTLLPGVLPVRVRVAILEPLMGRELAAGSEDAMRALRDRVTTFLRSHGRA